MHKLSRIWSSKKHIGVDNGEPIENQDAINLVGLINSGGESEPENKIEIANNRIYFYSEVDRPNVLAFNTSLRALDDLISGQSYEWSAPFGAINIEVHINSFGGSIFDGLSAVDYIQATKNPVHSYIDGAAASAATIMSVVADKRFISSNSFMLIHQLSAWHGGKYTELQDEMQNCDMLMATIKKIYSDNCKIPKKKLKNFLKHDLWFDAKTCYEYGLVDEII